MTRSTARLRNWTGAVDDTLVDLEKWRKSAGQKIGGPVAKIFDTQMMIASDREFLKKVKEGIKSDHKNADYVYSMLIEETVSPLRNSSDPYMRQMVFDIEAVSQRIIGHLAGLVSIRMWCFRPIAFLWRRSSLRGKCCRCTNGKRRQ